MSDVLNISCLRKEYASSGNGSTLVLDGLDLSLKKGETLALLGPTGCGKSTLLYHIAGLLQPTAGEVRLYGETIVKPDQRIALVLQEYGLFPWKSVRRNVELGLRIRHKRVDRDVVDQMLERMGILDKAGFYPHQLSGGQKQRVALGRALLLNPDVLLLDEPFAALDTLTRERLQDLGAQLWHDQKMVMILVTHNINEAVRMGHRIAVMSAKPGRIVEVIDNPGAMSEGQRGSDDYFRTAKRVRKVLETVA